MYRLLFLNFPTAAAAPRPAVDLLGTAAAAVTAIAAAAVAAAASAIAAVALSQYMMSKPECA